MRDNQYLCHGMNRTPLKGENSSSESAKKKKPAKDSRSSTADASATVSSSSHRRENCESTSRSGHLEVCGTAVHKL